MPTKAGGDMSAFSIDSRSQHVDCRLTVLIGSDDVNRDIHVSSDDCELPASEVSGCGCVFGDLSGYVEVRND